VFHYYADHPLVGTVILSNTTLDAAKTNRCVQVLLPKVDFSDLVALAEGLLMGGYGTISEHDQKTLNSFITGACKAFQKVNKFADTKKDLFDLRDFVYFLRDIRRQVLDLAQPLKSETIYHALARNFNGVSSQSFEKIVESFFSHVSQVLVSEELSSMQEPEDKPSLVEIVRESVELSLVNFDEDPNQASHRYIMLVDPTRAESSVNALRILGIPQGSAESSSSSKPLLNVISVSDFPEDDSEMVKSKQVSDVKNSMEMGETVLMINSGPIQTNFYELFNRYFVSAIGNDKKKQYYANVAVGSYSRPCPVHPKFQIIISIPQDEFKNAPAPFLNRFEKYVFSLQAVFYNHPNRSEIPDIDKLFLGSKRFIRHCEPSSFYGLVEDETLFSLMINIISDTTSQGSKIPVIPEAFTFEAQNLREERDSVEEDLALQEFGLASPPSATEFARSNSEQPTLREWIRRVNLYLMQIAKPEAIYLLKDKLPKAYLVEYLMKQEHFSVLNLFDHLVQTTLIQGQIKPNIPRKWVIYTRTSGEIYQLSTDPKIKALLLSSLLEGNDEDTPPEILDQKMAVLPLANIGSSVVCEKEVARFFESPTQKILLCTCDMSLVSELQLNYLKKVIDKHSSAYPERLVVVLVHFPPSGSQLSDCYNTIYTLGWNFTYIDSFGAQYLFGLHEDEDKATLIRSPDIRKWIRVAFSLDKALNLGDYSSEFNVTCFPFPCFLAPINLPPSPLPTSSST